MELTLIVEEHGLQYNLSHKINGRKQKNVSAGILRRLDGSLWKELLRVILYYSV